MASSKRPVQPRASSGRRSPGDRVLDDLAGAIDRDRRIRHRPKPPAATAQGPWPTHASRPRTPHSRQRRSPRRFRAWPSGAARFLGRGSGQVDQADLAAGAGNDVRQSLDRSRHSPGSPVRAAVNRPAFTIASPSSFMTSHQSLDGRITRWPCARLLNALNATKTRCRRPARATRPGRRAEPRARARHFRLPGHRACLGRVSFIFHGSYRPRIVGVVLSRSGRRCYIDKAVRPPRGKESLPAGRRPSKACRWGARRA